MIVEVSREPSVLQYNCSVLSENVRPRIPTGTEQSIKNAHRDALCRRILSACHLKDDSANIHLVLAILLAMSGVPLFCNGAFITILALISESPIPEASLIYLGLGIILLIPAAFLFRKFVALNKELSVRKDARLKACRNAVETVKAGEINCFRYKITQVRKFVDRDDEGVRRETYYLDLGEFCVYSGNKPGEWAECSTAYAAVINIDGEEFFFLFHCE